MTRTATLLCVLCLMACPALAPAARPNFVIIVADDLAWDDCGAYGHPTIKTPHIDALAATGLRFDRAFLTISSCSPSRASIVTGRYPHRTDAEELHWPLPAEQTLFVDALREAGYWCGAAGKWHLGDEVLDRFDRVLAADPSGFQLPTGQLAEAGEFVEKQSGDVRSGCTEWIPLMRSRPPGTPFCVWLAALDPHRPYDQSLVGDTYQISDVRLPPYHPDVPEVRLDYLAYYAEITRLDRYVGEVMRELQQQQVYEETFVLFISDNGRPFPRDKTTLYDSGIKTPFIVRLPGLTRPNTVTRSLVSSIDVAATVLDLAGLAIPSSMDGKSFRNVLSAPDMELREFVFAEKNWHDFEDHARAVRDGRFKYIRNYYHDLPNTPPADAVRSPTFVALQRLHAAGLTPGWQQGCFLKPRPEEELYDTASDPHELVNLASSPAFVQHLRRLRDALRAWEQDTQDHVPSLRTADEFDRETGQPTPARHRPRRSKREMVAAGLTAK